jgi:hypothetical protein
MEPISIASAVALLAGKKLVEKVGSEAGGAGWGLANKMIGRVRGLFSASENAVGLAQLEAVEEAEAPGEAEIDRLAALVTEELSEAGKVAKQLAALVEQARRDPVLARFLVSAGAVEERASLILHQTVTGDDNIVAGTVGGDFTATRDSKER